MKYGLALGGGGARGAFEVGVWRALCELGKDICAISGTSVGAINGAAFAAGADAERLWLSIRPENIIRGAECGDLLSPSALIGSFDEIIKGGLNPSPLKSLIAEAVSEAAVRSSAIDFGLCAFSVTEKRSVELFKKDIPRGSLIDYIMASACFPVFRQVEIDGEAFTDGGVRNNIPEDMLIRRGIRDIISVSPRGIGVVKDCGGCGANIIRIRNSEPEPGLMDFEPEKLRRLIMHGYFECMKAFGICSGDIYYVNKESYDAAVGIYGRELVKDMEQAAELVGLKRYREYSFSELVKGVLSNLDRHEGLMSAVGEIAGSPRPKLYIADKNRDIANSVAYFRHQQDRNL